MQTIKYKQEFFTFIRRELLIVKAPYLRLYLEKTKYI